MSFNFFENYNEIKQWITDLDDMVEQCFEWCCKLRPDHSNRTEIIGKEWCFSHFSYDNKEKLFQGWFETDDNDWRYEIVPLEAMIKWYNLDRKGAAEEYDNYHIKKDEAMHKSNEAIDEFQKERLKRLEDIQRSSLTEQIRKKYGNSGVIFCPYVPSVFTKDPKR